MMMYLSRMNKLRNHKYDMKPLFFYLSLRYIGVNQFSMDITTFDILVDEINVPQEYF